MFQPLGILVLCTAALLVCQVIYLALRSRVSLAGKPTIPRFLFFLAKLCVSISMLCLLIELEWGRPRVSLTVLVPFLVLWLGGTFILAVSFHKLGTNLRMGIPTEQTSLVTSGIYRMSRNPIYLGLDCLMAASLIYAFSLLNLVAVIEAVLLHHRIILAEEKFLAERFQEYGVYRESTPRYLWAHGRP
jgi:protein-S-isoprenylcysteine O-methyltransferase Ste14